MKYYFNEKQLEDFPGEVWKTIEECPLYLVSNLGRVKAIDCEKWHNKSKRFNFYPSHIMSQCLNKQGYLVTHLIDKKGQDSTFRVNRLVAIAFIPNPINLPQVNHLNEDVLDNKAANLKWSTARENSNYGLRNYRVSRAMGTPVRCDGHEFTSITKAAKFYGRNPSVFWGWLKSKKAMPDEWKNRGLEIIKTTPEEN